MFQDGGVPAYGVCPRERDKRGPGLERRGAGAGDLICALHHDCSYLFDSLLLRQLNEETLIFRLLPRFFVAFEPRNNVTLCVCACMN